MPPLGLLVGQVDFSSLSITLREGDVGRRRPSTINYGNFINTIIDFLIVGFMIFMVMKQTNRLKRETPAPRPTRPSNEQQLLAEIRDLLRK